MATQSRADHPSNDYPLATTHLHHHHGARLPAPPLPPPLPSGAQLWTPNTNPYSIVPPHFYHYSPQPTNWNHDNLIYHHYILRLTCLIQGRHQSSAFLHLLLNLFFIITYILVFWTYYLVHVFAVKILDEDLSRGTHRQMPRHSVGGECRWVA
jgi:hypothetical protein